MKKNAIALGVLGLFSGLVSAQSSVTLYGVVDVAVERIKGATSLTRVTSGQQQGSRWGLRGTEDLGGGLKAMFVLENGFNADTGTLGQGGRIFGRQGYVGLGGGWGAVRLGPVHAHGRHRQHHRHQDLRRAERGAHHRQR